MNTWEVVAQVVGLGLATFASEDLALVGAAVLVNEHRLGLWTGLAGVGGGILVGDLSLWLAGRLLVGRLLRAPFLARRVPAAAVETARRALESHLALAVLSSRFIPGSRVPLHLAAGSLGRAGLRYALWTAAAVALWVPLVMSAVALAGERAADLVGRWLGSGWLRAAFAMLLGMALFRLAGRLRLPARESER